MSSCLPQAGMGDLAPSSPSPFTPLPAFHDVELPVAAKTFNFFPTCHNLSNRLLCSLRMSPVQTAGQSQPQAL